MNVHRATQKSPVLLSKHALDVQGTIGRNAVIIGKRSCTCTIFLFAANSQNNIRTCSKHCHALKMWGGEKEKHLILFYQKGPGISQADASILCLMHVPAAWHSLPLVAAKHWDVFSMITALSPPIQSLDSISSCPHVRQLQTLKNIMLCLASAALLFADWSKLTVQRRRKNVRTIRDSCPWDDWG